MNPISIIENELRLDEAGVWVRPDAKPFAYTDGLRSEAYLEEVLTAARDLSTGSAELASRIKDWPSEYHLTPARTQLLEGFVYDRSQRVLEVGCGCGAITRFLGETFAEVTAIEGSHSRARLARLRTRDLDNVTIVNSPFQQLRFKTRFDMIFCIGVFEYATMFVEAEDPHRKILDYFSSLLAPGGALVLAIENKFGLKYFASSAEDHSGILYDGIEGYPRHRKGARTFGRKELNDRLREHFRTVDFYYPWPDYKIPSCVIAKELIDRVDVAELVGSFRSRDYGEQRRPALFSEALAWREIAANSLVPEFAHSFLAVASKSEQAATRLSALGVLYNRQRRPEFATRTTFEGRPEGGLRAVKKRVAGGKTFTEGKIRHQACTDDWIDGPSLQATMMRRARAHDLELAAILEPSRVWFDELRASAEDATNPMVPGERLDSIWRNCFLIDGACRYIDREWAWTEPLPLSLVVSRGLYYFAQALLGAHKLNPGIAKMRVGDLILEATRVYGLALDTTDLDRLARFESAFLDQVTGDSGSRYGDVRAVLARRIGRRPRLVLAGPRRILRGIKRRLES